MAGRRRRASSLLAALIAAIGCGGPEDWATYGPGAAGKADDEPAAPAGEIAINTELKIFVAPAEQALAHRGLDLGRHDPLEREIAFYDTKDLKLYGAGLILRTRDTKGEPDDSTVKWRPMNPTQVDPELFEHEGFKCEEDRTGTRSVISCSLTVEQGEHEIDDVAAGDRAIDKLFCRAQEKFARRYAGPEIETYIDGDEGWPALEVLGPIPVRRWRLAPAMLDQVLTVEQWTLPDETVILELSIKVPRPEADNAQDTLRAFVAARGLDPDTPPTSKTRLALNRLAHRL